MGGIDSSRQREPAAPAEITVILLDGFADDEVTVAVGAEQRRLHGVTTKLLTGFAEQLAFAVGRDASVRIAVINRGLDHQRMAAPGQILLVSISGDSLTVAETDRMPGFL